jgi:DNA-binding CsgD family transcriptional regulator
VIERSESADRNVSPAHDSEEQYTIDEARVAVAYSLLLQQPGLDLEQFAQQLGCSQDTVRTILNRLTDLALLHRRHSEYGSLVAVSPIVAMQQLIAREHKLLRQRQQFLRQSYETFSSVLSAYIASMDGADAERFAEHLDDLPSVRRRLEELALLARNEVLSFSPTAGNPTATRAASRPLDLAALDRGVRMRTLYLETLAFEPEAFEYARELVAAGAEIRLVPSLPMRLIIIDRETAVIPRDPDDNSAGALVVRNKALVLALIALFESCWSHGRPLRSFDTVEECNAGERAVMRLLATGAKDEAIARHVGTSVRTVRRIVADLMERAEADSRFALGVYAATHDWL